MIGGPPSDRRLLVTALREEGYEVVELGQGLHLLSRLRAWVNDLTATQPFDLVIADAHVTAGFAYGVVERGGASIPDGATALLQPIGEGSSRRFGVSAVLERPFELIELMIAIRSRLG